MEASKSSFVLEMVLVDAQAYANLVKRAQELEKAIEEKGQADGSGKSTTSRKRVNDYDSSQRCKKCRKCKECAPIDHSPDKCKACGRPGHKSKECWRSSGACLRCGSLDHKIAGCPLLSKAEGGKCKP